MIHLALTIMAALFLLWIVLLALLFVIFTCSGGRKR